MKRNPSIELSRLLACLIVIGVHTSLSATITEHSWDASRLFFNCLLADGVAIFFMITGAFLFNNNYDKLLRKTFIHIIIPLVIFSVIGFYFLIGYLINNHFHYILLPPNISISLKLFFPGKIQLVTVFTYGIFMFIF